MSPALETPDRLDSRPFPAAASRDSAAHASPPVPGVSPTIRVLSIVAIYMIPLTVALRPIGTPVYEPDLWWHLRTGQWIVEHRSVPSTDPFSSYGQGKRWIAYSWLYEVILYGLDRTCGLAGIVLYRVALSLAIALALHRLITRRGNSDLYTTGLTAACLLAVAMLFSERPWLFTILFGILTLRALLDMREGRQTWLPALLPGIFVLWANIHIQFVYGLALLGLALFAPWIDRRLWPNSGKSATEAALHHRWRMALLTLACALATLVNPYSYHLYHVVLEYATQPGPFQFVNELKAPEFREPGDWMMLALAAAAVFVLGRRWRWSSFDLLLLTGCALLSFRARRDLWLIVVAAAAILSAVPARAATPSDCGALPFRQRLFVFATLAGAALLLVAGRGLTPSRLEKTAANVFPRAATEFVAQKGYAGPLFNDFNWGGYLIHELPSLPVAIDGRTNLYGDERLLRFGATWSGSPGWHEDPDLGTAGIVFADVRTPLAALLLNDDRFVPVFEDEMARIFVARRNLAP